MDLGFGGGGGRVKIGGGDQHVSVEIESGSGGNMVEFEKRKSGSGIRHAFDKHISKTWEVPLSVMLKLTIPHHRHPNGKDFIDQPISCYARFFLCTANHSCL